MTVPLVGLRSNGNFELSWPVAYDKLTVLEIRDDEMVNWLVFAPTRAGSTNKERVEGSCATELIMDRLQSHNALIWMTDA